MKPVARFWTLYIAALMAIEAIIGLALYLIR